MTTNTPAKMEPGTRVVLMTRIGDRDPEVVQGVEWAKIAQTQRSTHPDWIEVTFKRYGETRTETWAVANLRMDRR
jgi:hypothetical protein